MSGINKNKLIPLCLLSLSLGYFGAEWVIPKYFKPQENPAAYDFIHGNDGDTRGQFIAMLRNSGNYIRKTKSGNYLAGKFAQNNKDWASADKFISQVLPPMPQEGEEEGQGNASKDLFSHAMILAMGAGDYERAIGLAKDVNALDDKNIFANLFIALGYLKNAQYIEADKTLANLDENSIATFITPILSLWSNTLNRDGSVNTSISTKGLPPTNIYAYHALLIGLFTDQKQAVETYAIQAFNPEELDARDAEKFADIFYLYGQKDIAALLYNILKDRNFATPSINEKIANLEKNEDITPLITMPKIDSPKDGAALVLSDMAEVLIREYSDDVANIFARMASYLNPELEKPYFIISDIYTRNQRFDDAIAILNKIPASSKKFILAQRQISELYNKKGDNEKAIATLQEIYNQTKDIDALNQIGDIYRYNEEFENAVKTYTKILTQFEDIPPQYWYILYSRGMSFERLGKFDKAESDLLQALEFQPNQPYLLNYLGYSWADQGIKLEESLELIQQAYNLRSDDGYIADSLGWVHYKLGNYEDAVTYLERAVELLPYDATVNDHLGDAYWRNGRKNEATFQWKRALNNQVDNDLELKSSLEKKIKTGLSDKKSELSELPRQPALGSNQISDTSTGL